MGIPDLEALYPMILPSKSRLIEIFESLLIRGSRLFLSNLIAIFHLNYLFDNIENLYFLDEFRWDKDMNRGFV